MNIDWNAEDRANWHRQRRPRGDYKLEDQRRHGADFSYGPKPWDRSGPPSVDPQDPNSRHKFHAANDKSFWDMQAASASAEAHAQRARTRKTVTFTDNVESRTFQSDMPPNAVGLAATSSIKSKLNETKNRNETAAPTETWIETQQRRVGGIFYDLANFDRLDDAPDQSFMGKLRYIATRDDRSWTSAFVGVTFFIIIATFVGLFVSGIVKQQAQSVSPMMQSSESDVSLWNEPLPSSAINAARASGFQQ